MTLHIISHHIISYHIVLLVLVFEMGVVSSNTSNQGEYVEFTWQMRNIKCLNFIFCRAAVRIAMHSDLIKPKNPSDFVKVGDN